MSGSRVQVPVVLFHVFAVIALGASQAKQTLLQQQQQHRISPARAARFTTRRCLQLAPPYLEDRVAPIP